MPRKPKPAPTPAPTPAPAPAPAPAPTGASGIAMPGDVAGWTRIFADDFATPCAEGQFLATYPNWSAYPTGWKDTRLQDGHADGGTYDTSILSVANSVMSMRLHADAAGSRRVAAPFPRAGTAYLDGIMLYSLTYGRIATCFRADLLPGYKTAWLLWPVSKVWPRDGEIDFPEAADLTHPIHGFMHHQGATTGSDQFAADFSPAGYGTWHVAETVWSPGSCQFILDGVVKATTDRVPNTPMRYVMQTETALYPDPAPALSTTGFVQVDWVCVWSPG